MCSFDEGVDAVIALNLDPRKPGQALRTSIELPHGSGKVVPVAVFVKDPESSAADEARAAGRDRTGPKRGRGGGARWLRGVARAQQHRSMGPIYICHRLLSHSLPPQQDGVQAGQSAV